MTRRPVLWFLLSLAISFSAQGQQTHSPQSSPATATPIKHLVIIFGENISFDHYFGIYPNAANTPGDPQFFPAPKTPAVNGYTEQLITNNPNLNPANRGGATNPFRLGRKDASTADQDNDYSPEQKAYDGGLLDLFPEYVGAAGTARGGGDKHPPKHFYSKGLTLGYFDGNTVTGMWNYAQHYALNDNSFETTFGDSTLGAVNLVSGQTNGVVDLINGNSDEVDGGAGSLTLIGEPDPLDDVCSDPTEDQAKLSGKNIGDLLNAQDISWGWFSGGFNLTLKNPNGSTGCNRSSSSKVTGVTDDNDYSPHREPFQYYLSTANPTHVRPSSVRAIGKQSDAANHQYDVDDFFAAVNAGNFPAVSYLKAPTIQTGHSGESDPLDEQVFVVNTINFIQQSKEWGSTAIILAYDDSDGWYDHQMGPIVNSSHGVADFLNGEGVCGDQKNILPGVDPDNPHALARCGYGPRLPMLVISPWAKPNFVDHTMTDQTSILRFIEDNWLGGQRIGQGSFDQLAGSIANMFDFSGKSPKNKTPVILDPSTGLVVTPAK